MHVRVLASSSAGNCTLVRSGRTAVLIDCGLGPARLRGALEQCGLDLGGISGVLLTHTHGDHLHGAMLAPLRKSGVPVFCAGPVAEAIEGRQLELFRRTPLPAIHVLERSSTRIGTLDVHHFSVPHDAPGGCYGFVVRHGGKTLAFATDIGHVGDELAGWLSAADLAVVESNHDLDMLKRSGRPGWLIDRIRNRGHLSNDETAGLLRETLTYPGSRVRHVVLAHLSEECNTPALALESARVSAKSVGKQGVRIDTAHARVPMAQIIV